MAFCVRRYYCTVFLLIVFLLPSKSRSCCQMFAGILKRDGICTNAFLKPEKLFSTDRTKIQRLFLNACGLPKEDHTHLRQLKYLSPSIQWCIYLQYLSYTSINIETCLITQTNFLNLKTRLCDPSRLGTFVFCYLPVFVYRRKLNLYDENYEIHPQVQVIRQRSAAEIKHRKPIVGNSGCSFISGRLNFKFWR